MPQLAIFPHARFLRAFFRVSCAPATSQLELCPSLRNSRLSMDLPSFELASMFFEPFDVLVCFPFLNFSLGRLCPFGLGRNPTSYFLRRLDGDPLKES